MLPNKGAEEGSFHLWCQREALEVHCHTDAWCHCIPSLQPWPFPSSVMLQTRTQSSAPGCALTEDRIALAEAAFGRGHLLYFWGNRSGGSCLHCLTEICRILYRTERGEFNWQLLGQELSWLCSSFREQDQKPSVIEPH